MMFRLLVRLLPSDLRRRWGGEMERLYRARLEDAGGPVRRVRIRLGSWADVVIQAARTRAAAAGGSVRLDLRHAFRALAGAPGFSAAVVLTLTLGIGAPSAVFSVVDGVLLRPLPYRDAGELALVTSLPVPWLESSDARLPRGLEGLAGFSVFGGTVLSGSGEPARLRVMPVTGGFFGVLGVQAAAGRTLAPADDRPGAAPAAVVSHRFWSAAHGAVRPPTGETLELDGRTFEVVGVLPPGFTFYWYDDVDLWIATSARPDDGPPRMSGLARLAPGLAADAVRGSLEALSAPGRASGEGTAATEERPVRVTMLREAMVGDVRGPLLLFLAAATLVLAVAVGNGANLVLARTLARGREIAVRHALGASRGRVLRHLVAECGILAGAASILGLLAGLLSTRMLLDLAPGYVRRVHDVGLDFRVLAFAALAGGVATLGAGLVPGWLATRGRVLSGSRPATAGRGVRTVESGLVAAQLAVTLLLLSTGGVLVRTFLELRPADPGFRVEGLTVVGLELPRHRVTGAPEARALTADIVDRVRALPGVEAAEAATYLPLTGVSAYRPASSDDAREPEGHVHHRAVTAGYLEIMEMPLVSGRSRVGPGEVVVNASAVERFWPDGDPVGRPFHITTGDGPRSFTVVGVVGDARLFGGTTASSPEAFTALDDTPAPAFNLVLDAPDGVAPGAVRVAVAAADPTVPIVREESLGSVIAPSNRVPRFQATLVGSLALLALVLSALGTFAVFSHVATRRRREMGVRIAVGAGRWDVASIVLARGARIVGLGLAAGGILAVVSGEVLEAVLFGARPTELPLLLTSAALLAGVAGTALVLPALRVARVDPRRALEDE